jgi:predicted transposase YdaD
LKVHTKKGKEEWILVHIEVQGSNDKQFEKRMFTYYYRILDKYDRDIASLAILTDKRKKNRPTKYEREFLDTSLQFKFKTYKVLDAKTEELEASENPFAMVILVVQTALKKGTISEESMYNLKIELVKKLLRKNFPKPKIDALLRFLKLYVRFEKKELISKFDNELDIITNRPNTMGLKEFVLDRERRMARKEGKEEGREEGIELGMSLKEREEKTNFTKNLLQQTNFSEEKIADLVGVEINFVKEIKTSLS